MWYKPLRGIWGLGCWVEASIGRRILGLFYQVFEFKINQGKLLLWIHREHYIFFCFWVHQSFKWIQKKNIQIKFYIQNPSSNLKLWRILPQITRHRSIRLAHLNMPLIKVWIHLFLAMFTLLFFLFDNFLHRSDAWSQIDIRWERTSNSFHHAHRLFL